MIDTESQTCVGMDTRGTPMPEVECLTEEERMKIYRDLRYAGEWRGEI